ncbi:MAG: GNAT family N-acetyltransferase, partial [Geminicoccaceae bacterium]
LFKFDRDRMMAGWTIRRAAEHDAVPLKKCIDAAYAPYRKLIRDLPPVSEEVADDIKSNLVWVAELDYTVVGGLILVLNNEHAILANIAVDPDCKGMGIGRGLIDQAEAHCRRLKKAELRLSTHVDMPENVRLYKYLGWEQTERSANKVHMTKLL